MGSKTPCAPIFVRPVYELFEFYSVFSEKILRLGLKLSKQGRSCKLASCRWRYKRRKPNSTRITFNKKLTNNSGMLWRFPQRCKPGTASTSFCSSTSSRRVAVLTAEGAAQLDLPRSWAALHAIYLAPACCPQRRGAAVAPSTTRPFARAGIIIVAYGFS